MTAAHRPARHGHGIVIDDGLRRTRIGHSFALICHRPACYVLLVAGYGVMTSVARNLTEPREIALLARALLLARRARGDQAWLCQGRF